MSRELKSGCEYCRKGKLLEDDYFVLRIQATQQGYELRLFHEDFEAPIEHFPIQYCPECGRKLT